ncbi:MAG: acetate---CoA ligase (ADP-forming) subunit alpha [Candidatus Binatota bacterium]|jgi:acetyltransferase|nr:acetate---CoA ligase (ADP-forming) subunit alpha [Candidatus Binatota bacterium]
MTTVERFQPLFQPRGVVISGVSTHPGKWGFLFLHHILRFGYEGRIFALNREGAEVLGRRTYRSIDDVPAAEADLLIVCTPTGINADLLRRAAARGVRAAFVAAAGYGEAGDDGKELERELVEVANGAGMLLAGPNGQGLISTPAHLCAQMVAPYPPPGRISLASQSGNLVSSFGNYAAMAGVGVSRAISCGNSAQLGVDDYLDYFLDDPETSVAFAYLEGVRDGRRFFDCASRFTARKPLVVLKGGATALGQAAASSHTGSLASDDRIFDGVCRQAGITRCETLEESYEAAATFATQPLPRGRRVVVFTAAGGWGVLCADACVRAGLEVVPLPEDLRRSIDALLPSRWSRANPVDLAGGETRDTIPTVLDLLAAHESVDAVLYLGIGIQSANAALLKTGPYYPDHGLDRIVDFHERQDRRYAEAAHAASEKHGKPVLCASELVYTDRTGTNPGPQTIGKIGRITYPSAHRAVRALTHLVRYAAWRRAREL